MKNALKLAWELLVEGYDFVIDGIASHPKITFWVGLVISAIAILK